MSETNKTESLITNDANTILLEAKNISHEFDYKLFENINLNLEKKESIAIIGISGSGKSTLLNILSSLLEPIMIVGLGLVVAFIVFSVILPMMEMTKL